MMISLIHMDTLAVEATVRKMPNGDLLAACTCGGDREPAPENRVCLFRSRDGGRTWSPKELLCPEDGRAQYQSCLCVMEGKVLLFVSRHNGQFVGWENSVFISEDSGFTWRKQALELLPDYAFVRSMVRLSDGRYLFPYHRYPVTEEAAQACRRAGSIVCAAPIEYVENGILIGNAAQGFVKKIAFLQPRAQLPKVGGNLWNWSENTVAEFEAGHLVMLYRVEGSGRLWKTQSFDFGESWEKPQITPIPNPGNKAQLLRGAKGEVILLNTPNDKPGFYLRRRFPLEAWISYDGMQSWQKRIRISDFPGAYSYPDGFLDEDGHLKFAFEFNRHDVYFVDENLQERI